MPNSIDIESLTTCLVTPGGARIRLNFDDASGRATTLNLPTSCVHQLVMTLPHLLLTALRAQHGDTSARSSYPDCEWSECLA
ncbi:MAG TPA: hypothetical protein VNO35_32210 [Steroidobacteraceae bacterium]|jgi:hypothetical protein|nr:hypothetical protein [Steroidobacteraceae bacterium]